MGKGNIDAAVFLDFDGVLFDTVREAYCVAMLASGRARSAGDIDFGSGHYGQFRRYRFLITRASDYYHLLKAIDGKSDIEREYNSSLGSDAGGEKEFSRRYFAERNRLKSGDQGYWLSLNMPYGFLHSIKEAIRKRPEVFFIITTKDKDTIVALLKIHKIRFYSRNIFSLSAADRFKSKGEAIRFVCEKYAVRKGLYIDDSRYHLSQVSGVSGLDTLYAGWGYLPDSESAVSEPEALKRIGNILGG